VVGGFDPILSATCSMIFAGVGKNSQPPDGETLVRKASLVPAGWACVQT
jgi:hypothetical protein